MIPGIRLLRILAALLAFLLVQGCAGPPALPTLPDQIGNQGLLVARLYVLGMRGIETADLSIDGKRIGSGLTDGYVAVALAPGEHQLNHIRAMGQLLSSTPAADEARLHQAGMTQARYIYIPTYNYSVQHYTTLSVERKFSIEAGKITNLGLIVYIPAQQDPSKATASSGASRQFNVVAVDNGTEAMKFLETNYPVLMASMPQRQMRLEPGRYLEADKLPQLRRIIALHESRGRNVVNVGERLFVYGRAGTIVSVGKEGADGKPPVEALDTGTLADVVGVARHGHQVTFLTSDAQLLRVEGSTVTKSELPHRIQPVTARELGERGTVVVDNRMRILTRRSPDAAWVNHEGEMTKSARSDIGIEADPDGVYITLGYQGFSNEVYYLPANESVPRKLPTPPTEKGSPSLSMRHHFVARKAGLFTLFGQQSWLFWSKQRQAWAWHWLPPGKCKPMQMDEDGVNLKVECDGNAYESGNSGASWAAAKS